MADLQIQNRVEQNIQGRKFSELSAEEQKLSAGEMIRQQAQARRKGREKKWKIRRIVADKAVSKVHVEQNYLRPIAVGEEELANAPGLAQLRSDNNNAKLNSSSLKFVDAYERYIKQVELAQSSVEFMLRIDEYKKECEDTNPELIKPDAEYEKALEDIEKLDEEERDQKFRDARNEYDINYQTEEEVSKAAFKLRHFYKAGDKKYNLKLARDYREENEDYKKFVRDTYNEVISYNFSPRMLDPKWLGANAESVMTMIYKASLFGSMKKAGVLSDAEIELLDIKARQAQKMELGVGRVLKATGGVSLTYNSGAKIMKNVGPEVDEDDTSYITTVLEQVESDINAEEQAYLTAYPEAAYKQERRDEPIREGIRDLSLSDFIDAIGEKNRGQVVYRNGRLAIINNSYFRRKRMGAASAENIHVKRQFVEMALLRIDAEKRDAYRPYLRGLVGLNDADEVTTPLTRKQIVAVMQELKNQPLAHKKVMVAQGQQRLKSYVQKIESIFGPEPSEHDTKSVRKTKKNAIKRRIQDILRRKRAALNVSDRRLNRLIDEHMGLLKEEMYKNVRSIELAVANMNGGNAAAITDEDDLWERLAADAITLFAARSEAMNMAAAWRVDETIKSEVLERSGRQELSDKLESVFVSGFSKGAEKDFYDLVIERREHLFMGEISDKFQEDLEAFYLLVEQSAKLAGFNRDLLGRGSASLTSDKDDILKTATSISLLMSEHQENFDKIAQALQGTIYAEGYNELKTRLADGLDLVQTEKDIIEGLSAQHEDMHYNEEEQGVLFIRKMSPEDEAVYAGLSKTDKAACDVLLLRHGMSEYIKTANDETCRSVLNLLNILRTLPKNKNLVLPLNLGGAVFKLEQNNIGELFVEFGGKRLRLPTQSEGLIAFIERDMCENVSKYGKAVVNEEIVSKMDQDNYAYKLSDFTRMGKLVHDRDLAMRILVSLMDNAKLPYFETVETETLVDWARRLITSDSPAVLENIKNEIHTQAFGAVTSKHMNGKETYRIVKKLDQKHQQEIPVRIMYENKISDEEEDGEKWTKDEKAVKDFIADLFMSHTIEWDTDEDEGLFAKHTELMKTLIIKHFDTIQKIYNSGEDMELIDRVVHKMEIPDMSKDSVDYMDDISKQLKYGLISIDHDMQLKNADIENIKKYFSNREKDHEIRKSLDELETKVLNMTNTLSAQIQAEVTTSVNIMFSNNNVQQAPTQLRSLTDRHITDEEKQKRLQEHNKELNRRIAEEAKGNSGQGALTKEILKTYFRNADQAIQRNMIASMFRHATPKRQLAPDSTAEEKKAEEIRVRSNMLGGILKGAGPLLQKIMQGLPEQGMTPEFKLALKDMKSNLLPIPEEVVKARLTAMVQRSNGLVDHIDVVRSLGAASVGQAFLCRLYGPNLPKEGEEVVIKLLRPEAGNQMSREYRVIRAAAKEVDQKQNPNLQEDEKGSTSATLEGQMESIMAELDLSVEARNANIGSVYNSGDTRVKSVGVSQLIMPNTNTLVLEKANGTTVDRYIKDVNSSVNDLMKKYYTIQDNKVVRDQATGKPVLNFEGKQDTVTASLDELEEILTRLEKRQKYLTSVAEKWVREGIYGEGFYHGDLHAGNIMIDDDGATIIDFGNATKLTEDQKSSLTKLTASAAAGDTDYFLEAFETLLPVRARAGFNAKKRDLKREVVEAFSIGNKESAGLRISLVLLKAQSLGIEVPASINNFSQSQIRIQNTIDEMNQMIEDIKQNMQTLSAQEQVPKERPAHNEKPKQFFTVMTEVLMQNLAVSLKRLNFFKAAKYRKKLA